MKPINRAKLARRAFRALGATSLLLVLLIIGLSIVIRAQAQKHEARRADAILVMGAAQWDGKPSPVLEARLTTALSLYRRGLSNRLILTGGIAPGDVQSEAAVARSYMIENGVDPAVLLIEEQGRDSVSSLMAAATIAQSQDIRSVVVVTDPYHELRALKIARDLGLEAYGEPVDSTIPQSSLERIRVTVYEAVGYLGYVLFGR